jgi:hypothetical protein
VDRFVAVGSVEKSKNMRKPPVNDELLNIYANEHNKVQKKIPQKVITSGRCTTLHLLENC